MKPSELRRGNLVNTKHQINDCPNPTVFFIPVVVANIYEKSITTIFHESIDFYDDEEQTDERIKPIIPTEDLLLKFNFEKEPVSLSIDISDFEPEYKKLIIDVNNEMIAIRCGEKEKSRHKDELIVIFNGDVRKDFSIHLIQNIYNSLTGKELILNKTK